MTRINRTKKIPEFERSATLIDGRATKKMKVIGEMRLMFQQKTTRYHILNKFDYMR